MRRLPNVYAMALAALCLTASAPLNGQNPAEDPILVAATWAIERHGLTGLGSRLVVDSVRGAVIADAMAGRLLPGTERQSRRVLASSLSARVGALKTHFVCPPEPVVIAGRIDLMHRGCRLTDGVEGVVQIDAPRATDDGFEIAVTAWKFFPHPLGDGEVWVLTSNYHELRLRRDPSGDLTVTAVLTTIGHW